MRVRAVIFCLFLVVLFPVSVVQGAVDEAYTLDGQFVQGGMLVGARRPAAR